MVKISDGRFVGCFCSVDLGMKIGMIDCAGELVGLFRTDCVWRGKVGGGS